MQARQAHRMPASDRKHQLLEAALEVFSRKGFDGTTTKEIAAAAGVTEAVIFRHFPSKQALYEAVLDYHVGDSALEEWIERTKAFMEKKDDAGVLRTVAGQILQSYREDPRYQRAMLFAGLEGHEQGLQHYRRMSLPIFELLRDYVARRQSEGALEGHDPGLIIAAIGGMALNYAMMTQMLGFRPEMTDQQVTAAFTSILMDGIRPRSEGKEQGPQ